MGLLKWFVETCTDLRKDILSADPSQADAITAVWPGGAKNPERRVKNWARCYGKLHAINAVSVRARLDNRDGVDTEKKAAFHAALEDAPEYVTLAAVDEEGVHRRMAVYPKSIVALQEIHKRNVTAAALIEDVELLQQSGSPDDLPLLLRAHDEILYLQRVMAWIGTTEGVGLPFPEGAERPMPPSEISTLHPADLFTLAGGFQQVNLKRLLLMDRTRATQTRPDFAVFVATMADALHRPTPSVMRDQSLVNLMATAVARVRGQEQAQKEADLRQLQNGKRVA